ncbi:hypothetical protein ACFE04_014241 [Oxalis oulophora]
MGLADHHEKSGEVGKAINCLEAIFQSNETFFPIIEVKTRVRIATLLLKHTHNIAHAKSHLERSQILLSSIPSCIQLKCNAYSLLSQCYLLLGDIPRQKYVLFKAIDLTKDSGLNLWSCNFNSQLANAFTNEADYLSALVALEAGYGSAAQISYAELQLFFATSILHVNLMQWHDPSSVQKAINKCDEIWNSIDQAKREQCLGLMFYNELLHIFYRLRICDYKNALPHVDRLDAAMKQDRERVKLSGRHTRLQERLQSINQSTSDKLVLAPPPIDGEWLPKSAVYSLVDLMVIVLGRPTGQFRLCTERFHTGINLIQAELERLGIIDGVKETDLQLSTIWMTGVYLLLLMQFFQNKVAVELTRSEFVEAQEALLQMKIWFLRFPTILQSYESMIEMLRGLYANSVGCYEEAVFHYNESAKLTECKSTQTMCQVYESVSTFASALDLITPLYSMKDSVGGLREEASVLFAYGLITTKQQNIQDAQKDLVKGMQIALNHMGNLQLVSQYSIALGSLDLALHDTENARDVLRSSITLARKLCDIPTQICVLSLLTALYQQLGEKGYEMENDKYRTKKINELHRKLADARSSIHHLELIERSRFEVEQQHNEVRVKRARHEN